MARTKKVDETNIEEVVTPLKVENTVLGTVNAPEAKAEAIKLRTIIAKEAIPLRSNPSLEAKYIVGKMSIGVAYEIVKEVNSVIYGNFYKLSNGFYVSKNGNYSIN